MKLDDFITLSLSLENIVLWWSHNKIHRVVAAPCKEYTWQGSFFYLFVGLVVMAHEIFVTYLRFSHAWPRHTLIRNFTCFFSLNGRPFPFHRKRPGFPAVVFLACPVHLSLHCRLRYSQVGGAKIDYTAKTKYRNFETIIPRKGISGYQPQFPHSCVCERFIYSYYRSPYSAGGNM